MDASAYDHHSAEKQWAEAWRKHRVYEPNLDHPNSPFYNLMMFPYPSAEGLHVGNMYAFSGADIYGRYQRMQGKDVFEPIGLDGFGIHSENYAIKIGVHPVEQAKKSQENFYRQLGAIGSGFSWDERLETYDPEYYTWTQWLFVQMFKNGLAYKASSLVNWCPSCKTVLADEQVEDGVCERCKTSVERREAKQWFFRITKYADQLLANIEKIKWPEKIKNAQRQWIGRQTGLEIDFKLDGTTHDGKKEIISVWTKFWETMFGITYLVLAPEYPHVESCADETHKTEVRAYIKKALHKTEQQRKIDEKDKTGVFTGAYAINPATNEKIPIWIADYVLKDVGTGAVMGVPSHDLRDFAFAKKYSLPLKQVVSYDDATINTAVARGEKAFEGKGVLINSGEFSKLSAWGEGKENMKQWMIRKKFGRERTTYHLRDWLISRQRYWGPPIPMVECAECGWQPVPEDQLPIELPFVKDYKPTGDGKSPLERAPESWLYTPCPKCGKKAKRETDVSDTFLDSSWYFLRYPSVHTKDKPFDSARIKTWLPVNAYIGGAEHAVLHLLYARFVTMALKDWKYLDFDEPFPFLFGHGLIIKDGAKMSKSKGNVVNPDEYIEKFSADALRTYLMFLGPYDQGGDFRDAGISGMYRWQQKIWRLFHTKVRTKVDTTKPTTQNLLVKLQRTIKKCTEDMAAFRFNTSIAMLMECANVWSEDGEAMEKKDAEQFLKLFAPFMPFMAEEIYQEFIGGGSKGKKSFTSIHTSSWPTYQQNLLVEKTVEIIVQVNGKLRGRFTIDANEAMDKTRVAEAAKGLEKVAELLKAGSVKNTVVVPGKLVNFVLEEK
ncbi:MAG TPA: leucine--tRNA ligase [Candidatus Pacebacteria bacterium]|nr:MAG: Leucine-tRNA ligase [Microgenomates group bacterium GW2011_GWB1_45_17]KKU23232.1 MAG: Leucine-tRNA ligase [Microgenomates group bacterium GW2011_GWA1_46_15]KKU23712.1 MAG: leucyl-tRNA synthetase, leucyl-tRNA synthetase [Microgenomates group bacterium GW2011_GWC1_46_15]HAV15644.1 leucine--tRNA ligase [Candidatus Paceibacterota bacterium]HCR11269.1 leucine--tRNA ligase [Candidatus Paceibacterota bacterium]